MLLSRFELNKNSILDKGKELILSYCLKAHKTVSEEFISFHPQIGKMAKDSLEIIGLNIGAVDYVTTDILKSPQDTGGKIIEIQDNPTFIPTNKKAQHFFESVICEFFK